MESKRISGTHQFTSKVERNEAIEKISRNGWVEWGEDNIYPQHQNSWAYDNAVHGGIINQKVRFITSGGLTFNGDVRVLENYDAAFSMQEVVESSCTDLETNEQFYIHYKRNLNGEWEAKNVEACLIRVDETGNFFHYSEDWSIKQQSKEKTGYRTIKSIHDVNLEDDGDLTADRECLMQVQTRPRQRVVKDKQGKAKLTSSYYPIPNYSGALTSIKAGIKMTFFVYSEVANGYKGGTWINLANGVPATIEEENKIIEKVKSEASDEDLWGGLVVTFSDGKDREPRISQINGNDLDKRYTSSKKDVVREIMIAHGVISPALFGVISENMFGSKEEMEIAYVLFQDNYVKNRQRTIIEPINWANKKLNGITESISFEPFVLILNQNITDDSSAVSAAINGLSPLVATKVLNAMTPNEVRTLGSLPPLEGGDVIAEPSAFASEKQVIKLFSSRGLDAKRQTIRYSQAKKNQNEKAFKKEYIKTLFNHDLSKDQTKILSLIKAGEPYSTINKAINKGANYLSKQLIILGDFGLVDDWTLTKEGVKATTEVDELSIMYSYELRSDAPNLVPGGSSRPFCEQLISLNRLYTLQDINAISATIGRDVFLYRGGWYHNPTSDINTPSCRHEWRIVVV
tara:strand:+ start:13077 stop:14966 length:1890 start_codon:yes stop_codon:yes gene_type:complete